VYDEMVCVRLNPKQPSTPLKSHLSATLNSPEHLLR